MRSEAAAAINLWKALGEKGFTLFCCSFPGAKTSPSLRWMLQKRKDQAGICKNTLGVESAALCWVGSDFSACKGSAEREAENSAWEPEPAAKRRGKSSNRGVLLQHVLIIPLEEALGWGWRTWQLGEMRVWRCICNVSSHLGSIRNGNIVSGLGKPEGNVPGGQAA